jgi:hypothetical protein
MLSVFQSSFTSNSFRIRSCVDPKDFFRIQSRILLKVSDPTESGSTTLILSVAEVRYQYVLSYFH